MEHKLEKMRQEVQKRIGSMAGLSAVAAGLALMVGTQMIPMRYTDERITSFMMGFQLGLLIVLEIIAVGSMVSYRRALKDDTKLKKLYYKENDERELYIDRMAGQKSMNITMVILVLSAVIVSYFSIEAFAALCGAVIVVGLVKKGVRIYYSKTLTGEEE